MAIVTTLDQNLWPLMDGPSLITDHGAIELSLQHAMRALERQVRQ